jgi:antitoxin component of MazEF toxin-antitoxin module
MPSLISIGHSKAIPIPKVFIDQAHLENQELQFKVVKEGLLISPVKSVRQSWKESIEAILKKHGQEIQDQEWLDAPLVSNEEWEW